tara:strand:- start:1335 stop:2222 length:888 start_codon:yes stop_codon:yes gene_type:complete
MIKITSLILFCLFACSPPVESASNTINFDQILKNQNMTDSEKITDLQIQISKQEDQILRMQKNADNLSNSLDSLRTFNDSVTFYLESQVDSFRLEQSMLIGPEFSNNIIKLYNKVNILEDRAFFMDSLYFELVTDMVLIENQISSIENSIKEIDAINKTLKSQVKNESEDSVIDYNYEYKVAHQMYMRGNYESSLSKFRFLLNNKIDKDLADNCQFWIAQIFFSKNNFSKALDEFSKVLEYSNSNKKSESIYKMGLCHLANKNNSNAKEMFQRVVDNYPKSKYYNKAYEFILNIE